MNILIVCEESQTVCIEFRKHGHNAFSADIQECSGGHPEWHILGDVLPLLNGSCTFKTMNGCNHSILGQWDMIIGFPPCTYLTFAGNQCLSERLRSKEEINERKNKRKQAAEFFMKFVNADCNKICIENPLGYMSTYYRPPDQIVHPYYFGNKDNELKRTCFWLKGLPILTYNKPSEKPKPKYIKPSGAKVYFVESCTAKNNKERQKIRSKTFRSIAVAMSEQWNEDVCNYYLL